MNEERIKCPHCGEWITDLWEFFRNEVGLDAETETDCTSCGKPVVITRRVSTDYEITTGRDKEGG